MKISKNKLNALSKLIEVRVGEKFTVSNAKTGEVFDDTFELTENGELIDSCGFKSGYILAELIAENLIVNEPKFIPDNGETVYFVEYDGSVSDIYWGDTAIDNALFAFGNCFRTRRLAEKNTKHILEKLKDIRRQRDEGNI